MRMSERAIIPTFVFWAFLTIITPTLILLSENSKAELHLNGNITETMKARRIMNRHTQNLGTAPPPASKLVLEEELAPAPAATVSLPSTTPSRAHSRHNHTIISNNSNSTNDASKSKFNKQMSNTTKVFDSLLHVVVEQH